MLHAYLQVHVLIQRNAACKKLEADLYFLLTTEQHISFERLKDLQCPQKLEEVEKEADPWHAHQPCSVDYYGLYEVS